MRLREIQNNFKNTIFDADTLEISGGAFRDVFANDHGISLENRMKIYRNNVVTSLCDALVTALPLANKLVGEDFLRQAARLYIGENLPREGNLNLYGRTFPDFLEIYKPAEKVPYLSDIVRFEQTCEDSYYAADDIALDPQELTKINEDDLPDIRFECRASVKLISSSHPLDTIVDFCRQDAPTEPLELPRNSTRFLIFRPAFQIETHKLSDEEYLFLDHILQGKTLQQTAENLLAAKPEADLQGLLQKFLSMELFKKYF